MQVKRNQIIAGIILIVILDVILLSGAIYLVAGYTSLMSPFDAGYELNEEEIEGRLDRIQSIENNANRILMGDSNVHQLLEENDELKVCTLIQDSNNVDLFYLVGNGSEFVGNKSFFNTEDNELWKFSIDIANEDVKAYSAESKKENDSDFLITLSIQDQISGELDDSLVESTFSISNHPVYWNPSEARWIYDVKTSGEVLVMPSMSSRSGAGGFDDHTTFKEIYNKNQFTIDSKKLPSDFDAKDRLGITGSAISFRTPYTTESHEIKVKPDQTVLSDLETTFEINDWNGDDSDLSHEWYVAIHSPSDPESLSPDEIEKYGLWKDQYGNYYCSGCVLVSKGNWLKSTSDEIVKTIDKSEAVTNIENLQEINVSLKSHLGGSVSAIAISGGYAYVGQGQDFVVLDVDDASNPVEIGRVTIPSFVNDVDVAGDYAYLACKDTGLVIVDVSEPAKPEIETSFDTADHALTYYVNGIDVAGKYAYMTSSASGLVIVDISHPSNPEFSGIYEAHHVNDVVVSGNFAYVAGGSKGLMIVDISNPSTPTLTGNYSIVDYASDVAVSGDYAYVTSVNNGTIYCIDIHMPAKPVLECSHDAPGCTKNIAVSENHIFVSSSEGLLVFNISYPTVIVPAGNYSTTTSSKVVVSGNYAYVADGANGLSIVDISNPSALQLTGSYDNAFFARSVTVSDNHIYIAAYKDGLLVTDISDPNDPEIIGSCDFDGSASDIAISGDHAYVTSYDDGLVVFDISEPSEPKLIGSCYPSGIIGSGHFSAVTVSGNTAYVASSFYGLYAIDISTPSSPRIMDNYRCYAYGVDISGKYAYVAGYWDGLLIIDVSDPTSLYLVGSYDADGFANDVTVSGNSAYVTYTYSTFEYSAFFVIDVSDPTEPELSGSYDTHFHESHDVDVCGNYAYLADFFIGLTVVDISDPKTPTVVCTCDTPGDSSHSLEVYHNNVYLADYNNGLAILSSNISC
jgi:hypothetical protein